MGVTPYERRGFSGTARATALQGGITGVVATILAEDLSTWAGLTSTGPGTATINRDKSDEEVITFTGISGNNLTGVTQGEGGTTRQDHLSGATLEHTTSKIDADESNAHIADTTLDHHTQYLKKSAVTNALLAHVQYAPDPAATYAGTNAVAALDSTHMRVPDFAPATTLVRVVISGVIYDVAAADGKRPAVCVITQGTTTVVGALMNIEGGLTAYAHTFHVEEYVTVVAGTTYHWDVGYVAQGTSGPTIYAYGGTTIGTAGGPLVCSVFSA